MGPKDVRSSALDPVNVNLYGNMVFKDMVSKRS
jgi:hypothetical protein